MSKKNTRIYWKRKLVGRIGTGGLPGTVAPPDQPLIIMMMIIIIVIIGGCLTIKYTPILYIWCTFIQFHWRLFERLIIWLKCLKNSCAKMPVQTRSSVFLSYYYNYYLSMNCWNRALMVYEGLSVVWSSWRSNVSLVTYDR